MRTQVDNPRREGREFGTQATITCELVDDNMNSERERSSKRHGLSSLGEGRNCHGRGRTENFYSSTYFHSSQVQ